MRRSGVLLLCGLAACASPPLPFGGPDAKPALAREARLEEELRRAEHQLAPDDPERSAALLRLASHYASNGRRSEALLLVETSVARRDAGPAGGGAGRVAPLLWLARETPDTQRAIAYAEQALAIEESAEGLEVLAGLELARGDARRALALAERAAERRRTAPAADLGNALALLGQARRETGAWAAARPPLEQSLALAEETGAPPAVRAERLAELARVHLALGDARRAEALLERAVALEQEALGGAAPRLAERLDQLAAASEAAGSTSRALRQLQRSRRIRERSIGARSPAVALSCRRLAATSARLAYPRKAERLCREALSLDESALFPTHPRVADDLLCLAHLRSERDDEALALALRAHELRESGYGPAHPEVADAREEIARRLHARGDAAGARAWYESSLAVGAEALGPAHPRLLPRLEGLAALALERGDGAEAKSLLARALGVRERTYGPAHVEVALAAERLADLHYRDPQPEPARSLYLRALAIREALPDQDLEVAGIASRLAGLAWAEWQLDRAEALYDRAERLYAAALGPDHPFTRMAEQNAEQVRTARRAWGAAVSSR